MGPDIAAGWLIGIPNVLPHSHAVEALLVDWRPSLLDHPPCPICDYLSHPNASMPYCLGPPVLVMKSGGAADDKPRHRPSSALWGSWVVTGEACSGDRFGGGDTRYGVCAAGSLRCITV